MTDNALIPPPHQNHAGMVAEQARAATETPAALLLASRQPRDEDASLAVMLRECECKSLAEKATFDIDRNGKVVAGASIHLMETVAQAWGNISFGWRELAQTAGPDGVLTSTVECWAWELERNVRRVVTILVKHQRWLKPTKDRPGRLDTIHDPNMAYEHVANMAQRRVRTCLEAVVPHHLIEVAKQACEVTRKNEQMVDLPSLQKLQEAFESLGVSQTQLEQYMGGPITAMTHSEFAQFKLLFRDLRDGKQDTKRVFALDPSIEDDE